MKKHEKIDLIKSGRYIIENDMLGSDEAKEVLNIMPCEGIEWSSYWDFYGIDYDRKFRSLYSSELNYRPRFKMSELVGVDKITEPKEVFTVENYTHLKNHSHGAILTDEYMIKELNKMAFDAYKTK